MSGERYMRKIISIIFAAMLIFCTGCGQTNPEEEILSAVDNIGNAHSLYFENFIAGNMVSGEKLSEDKNPYPNSVYYAHKEEYDTVEELKTLACTYFSEEVFENKFMNEFEAKHEDIPPYLVEVDGIIYTNCNYGVGGSVVFMTETAQITYMDKSSATVEMQYYNTMDETAKETTTVNMVYENGKWVFNQAYLLN